MQPPTLEYLSRDETLFFHYNVIRGKLDMPQHHIHDFYEIYYLLSGERDYFIKDKVYSVKQGDLVLVPKYMVHRTIDVGAASHERIVINFKDALLERLSDRTINLAQMFKKGRYKLTLNISGQNYVENLFHRMTKEIKEKPAGFDLYLKMLTIELLIAIHRYMEDMEWEQLSSHATPIQQKISDIAGFINDHYDEPVTITMLANRFYLSASYLSRIFKEVSGFSLIEYLNLVRIKEAQKLLRETKLKIVVVAKKVGFGNISHFCKMFRHIVRLSPREYRNISSGLKTARGGKSG